MDVSVWKITKEIKCVFLKDGMVRDSTLCIHDSSIECVQCVLKRNYIDNTCTCIHISKESMPLYSLILYSCQQRALLTLIMSHNTSLSERFGHRRCTVL